jgi:hypothetical protein
MQLDHDAARNASVSNVTRPDAPQLQLQLQRDYRLACLSEAALLLSQSVFLALILLGLVAAVVKVEPASHDRDADMAQPMLTMANTWLPSPPPPPPSPPPSSTSFLISYNPPLLPPSSPQAVQLAVRPPPGCCCPVARPPSHWAQVIRGRVGFRVVVFYRAMFFFITFKNETLLIGRSALSLILGVGILGVSDVCVAQDVLQVDTSCPANHVTHHTSHVTRRTVPRPLHHIRPVVLQSALAAACDDHTVRNLRRLPQPCHHVTLLSCIMLSYYS